MPESAPTVEATHDQAVAPFHLHVPNSELDDLKARLARTRWPDELPGTAPDYGAALAFVQDTAEYWRTGFDWRDRAGYQRIQQMRPQTIGFALADSSVGQLAWSSELFTGFGGVFGNPQTANRDLFLTHVSLSWFTRTAASSSRIYYEDAKRGTGYRQIANVTPTGVAVFPGNFRTIRSLAERTNNIVHWSQFDRGGHFAAIDAPDLLVDDLRSFFRRFR
jgi:Epoxide hydrolase N terminus